MFFHFRSHKGQKGHYKAKSQKVAKKSLQGSKFDVIIRKKLFRNTPDMIKSGQFRNNDTTYKKVSGGSKNLEISKNNIKQFQSSLLIPTNFVFTLFLKCQIFEPTTHFFGCCIVVPENPTLNHVQGIFKYFFPYYSIKFGALEPPHCNFL